MSEPKKSTPKNKKIFTIRQQKYKANRIAGMSQHNAAIAAGYSETYALQACRIERLAKVSIRDALERAGLTTKYQAKKAFELTEATDGHVRLRALEHVAKLKKQLFEDKPITVNVEAHTHLTLIKKFLTKAKGIDVNGRIKSAISG